MEVYCDNNNRDISIDFSISQLNVESPSESIRLPRLSKIRLNYRRPGQWRCEHEFNKTHQSDLSVGPSGVVMDGKPIDTDDLTRAISDLNENIYIGPFRNAISEGASVDYYDLSIGNRFVSLWNDWKTGGMKLQNRTIQRVTEDIRYIIPH
jgi:hypothetical protein